MSKQSGHSFRLAATVLACAAVLTAAPTQAATYFAVLPLQGANASQAQRPVRIALAGATPPAAHVGESYEFNVGALLSLDGPEGIEPGKVSWSVVSGSLPAGLALVGDRVVGVPTELAPSRQVIIQAEYVSAQGTVGAMASYSFEIAGIPIASFGGYRAWEDGTYAQSCEGYIRSGNSLYPYRGAVGDGIYRIQPAGSPPFDAACDMSTDGGGWTVIQRRQDGSVNFYLGHAAYVAGFGGLGGEHWLGLEKIRLLSSGGKELRVDMRNKVGLVTYAQYQSFSLGQAPNYILSVSGYKGIAPDALSSHSGWGFTTYDAKYDSYPGGLTCAAVVHGAWWYSNCYSSNLNGAWVPYNPSGSSNPIGNSWGVAWRGVSEEFGESLAFDEMKVR